jgi:transmembrane sensor
MIEMNDDLLVKFLLSETTESENLGVKQWLAANPANEKHLNDLQLIWQRSKNLAIESTVDEDEAWKRFKTRVEAKEKPADAFIRPLWHLSVWKSIAAAIILIAGAWFFYSKILAPPTTLMASNEVVIETLPDGSEVTLNKNSSLSYSFPITAEKRLVKLNKGEVFFKVSPDQAKPFIIESHGVTIEVVGTSFNVNHSQKSTEVIVESGIVKVTTNQGHIILTRGQKVVSSRTGLHREPVTDNLHNYYRTNQFTASNTPLSRVVGVLNKAYKANVIIANPSLATKTLSTTLELGSLDQNVQLIAETMGLSIERRDSTIILK